ncbi:MAG: glycosyltransferase [Lentisphaerota bacterium]
MLFWLWLLTIASAVIWLVVYIRMRFIVAAFPALDSSTRLPPPASGWPFLSVVVPARNEERDVEACLQSLARQDYPAFEIIFVNDESTDRTLEKARKALQDVPYGKVLDGKPRPTSQWVGKNWALVQGVAEARGEWLVFIDSDVEHHPQALKQATAMAIEMRLDALSLMPAIECFSIWERIIMPLFALLSTLVEPLDRVNHPDKGCSRMSGAFILIQKNIYAAAGGHEAISDQILEDMALARNLKKQQRNIRITWTHDLTSTRMYDSFRDLWMGLTRLSFPMMKYSLFFLLVSWSAAVLGTLMPWIAMAAGFPLAFRNDSEIALGLGVAGLALCLGMPLVLGKICKVLKVSSLYALLIPIATVVYCLAGTYSACRHYTGRGVGWKQRFYQKPAS